MRSTPAWAASSKTRLDPSTLSSRVASLALRIAKARWTTTSAPRTRSRTLASSVTSPWRYSVLRQPRSPGSKGRRAMPRMRFTERERSSASTIPRPRSPVGPVTATVRPVVAMAGFYPIEAGVASARPARKRAGVNGVLAAAQDVVRVGVDPVLAGPAAHTVADAVARADLVVAAPGVERVGVAAAVHAVVRRARADAVASGPAVHVGTASVGRHHVVAGSRPDGHVAFVRADPVGARPGVHEVAAEAGIDPVRARGAEDAVGLGLAEQRVRAGAAEHHVGAGARVHHVVVGPGVDAVGARSPDHQVHALAPIDLVVAGAGLEEVVGAVAEQAVVAALAIDLVRSRGALELLAVLGADQGVRDRHRAQQAEERDGRHQY